MDPREQLGRLGSGLWQDAAARVAECDGGWLQLWHELHQAHAAFQATVRLVSSESEAGAAEPKRARDLAAVDAVADSLFEEVRSRLQGSPAQVQAQETAQSPAAATDPAPVDEALLGSLFEAVSPLMTGPQGEGADLAREVRFEDSDVSVQIRAP